MNTKKVENFKKKRPSNAARLLRFMFCRFVFAALRAGARFRG
jgi:hypothetical protein